jgi:hypothetical protein
MQRRTWDATTTAIIVREGLKGKPVADLCHAPQSSQAPYDHGRDPFLAHAPTAFEVHAQRQRDARLVREQARVKANVGELTLERNKRDEGCG